MALQLALPLVDLQFLLLYASMELLYGQVMLRQLLVELGKPLILFFTLDL